MEEKTADELAEIYTNAGHSVNLINRLSSKPADYTDAEWKDRIKRNVRHLELVKALKKVDGTTSVWTTENFTAYDAAVTAGKAIYE
tara:strand:- start:377 stop:634 length:258 start_codon:yes stop_codon:yes gene_type:complete